MPSRNANPSSASLPRTGPMSCLASSTSPSANVKTSGHNGTVPSPTNNPNTNTSLDQSIPSDRHCCKDATHSHPPPRSDASTGHSHRCQPTFHKAKVIHRNNLLSLPAAAPLAAAAQRWPRSLPVPLELARRPAAARYSAERQPDLLPTRICPEPEWLEK